MTEFAAEMDSFEETMAEVDDLLSEYETIMHGSDSTSGASPVAGD